MSIKTVPEWMLNLEDEDVVFIKRFILSSGSLKEMATAYDVTYPTDVLDSISLFKKSRLKIGLKITLTSL